MILSAYFGRWVRLKTDRLNTSQIISLSPHPYGRYVGGPYGRRSAPGIQRQQMWGGMAPSAADLHTGPPISLRSLRWGPLRAAFSAWHSTPNQCGGCTGHTLHTGPLRTPTAHSRGPTWREHRLCTPAPRIPTARWGPLWAALSAWYSTPDKCGEGTPGTYTSLPARRPLASLQLVGGPYGRRSAPGIPRQTNARGDHRHHTPASHVPTSVGCPYGRRSAPGIQRQPTWEGTALHHLRTAGCTFNSPPHAPVGKRIPLPHLPMGAP